MNKRNFLKVLLAVPAATIGVKLTPTESIFDRIKRQIARAMATMRAQLDRDMFSGVPYHQSDATTSRWLGFERDEWLYKKLKDKSVKKVHSSAMSVPLEYK